MNTFGNRVSAATLALVLMVCGRAFGGVSLVTQTDQVQISGSAYTTDGSAVGTPFSQTQTATVNVPFSASLQNTSTATTAVYADASASQTSLVSVSSQSLSLTATGEGSYNAGDITSRANGTSSYYVVFTVDTATAYTLTESTSQQGYVSLDDGDSGASLYPGQIASQSVPTVSSLVPALTDAKYLNVGPQTFSGTLSAGTYTLEGGIFAGGGPDDSASDSYSIDFAVGSSTTGSGSGGSGTGGTTAVPLPAAFWPGAGVLAMISLVLAARRRARTRFPSLD